MSGLPASLSEALLLVEPCSTGEALAAANGNFASLSINYTREAVMILTQGTRKSARMAGGLLAATFLTAFSTAAIAQSEGPEAEDGAKANQAGKVIIVTARKREERLIDVPLSIQAFSAEGLQKAGINNLEDLTAFTPGLDYKSQSTGTVAGRYLPATRFRGLVTISPLPSAQVGSLFVDGVYVLGGAQSIGLEDIERVEVIKGPQAAYFGRSTFGGAINYITADPADEFGGRVSAEYRPRYGSFRASGTIEGPLIDGVLSARLTASAFKNGAYETATDGGQLGEETTDAFHASLLFTPTSDIKIKFRGSYIEDEDTAPAATAIRFSQYSNCPIGTPFTVLDGAGNSRDVTLQGNQWCGALPENVPVTSNTTFLTIPENTAEGLAAVDIRDIFVNNSLGLSSVDNAPFLDHFGLRRHSLRLASTFEFTLSDAITMSGNAAYNEQDVRQIKDADFTDNPSVFVAPPNSFRDYSGEVKFNYDNDGPFRALGGVNYYNQKVVGAFTNAVEVTNQIFLDTFATPFSVRVAGNGNSSNNSDEIETIGVFGSVEYDILPILTVSLEGRYQVDKVTNLGGSFENPTPAVGLTSKEFLPRAIVTVRPMDDMTVYASYSEGTLPGLLNPNFIALPDADKDAIRAILPGIDDSIPPEALRNYEIGIKQNLLDGRLSYAIAAYYMEWLNIKSQVSFVPPGATGLKSAFISGSAEIKGIEFETSYSGDNFELGVTGNYNQSKYTDFIEAGAEALFGLTALEGYRVDGNTLPLTPKWSGSFSATTFGSVSSEWDWYLRGDALYQGKTFTNSKNLAWVAAYTTVNAKLGFERDDLLIELFANNLLGEGGWVSGVGTADFSEVPVLLSTLRTLENATVTSMRGRDIGVRMSLDF